MCQRLREGIRVFEFLRYCTVRTTRPLRVPLCSLFNYSAVGSAIGQQETLKRLKNFSRIDSVRRTPTDSLQLRLVSTNVADESPSLVHLVHMYKQILET